MIRVHHLNNSRSQRILWLLEELGLPYEVVRYQRDAKTMLAPPELRAVHPLGKSPVITDDDITVAESGAIIEYLIDRYGQGRLQPAAGTPERLRYTYWLHFAEGSAMPPLLMKLVFDKISTAPVPFFIKPIVKGIADKVTAFTASDFGRTLASNGDGSDHGWGSHHFVLGGAVNGGKFYGKVPDIGLDHSQSIGQGILIPTTSLEQMFAPVARWFGVSDSNLSTVFPNVGHFDIASLGGLLKQTTKQT